MWTPAGHRGRPLSALSARPAGAKDPRQHGVQHVPHRKLGDVLRGHVLAPWARRKKHALRECWSEWDLSWDTSDTRDDMGFKCPSSCKTGRLLWQCFVLHYPRSLAFRTSLFWPPTRDEEDPSQSRLLINRLPHLDARTRERSHAPTLPHLDCKPPSTTRADMDISKWINRVLIWRCLTWYPLSKEVDCPSS